MTSTHSGPPADPSKGNRRAASTSGRELFFIHINKCGGTSIEAAFGLPAGHFTVQEYIAQVGHSRWAAGFSFSFVRNPWDKVVSHYHWRVATNQTDLGTRPVPFREWVLRAYRDREPRYHDKPRMFMPQHQWLQHPDHDGSAAVAVDFLGRFENLARDAGRLAERLGRQLPAGLPHLKRTARPDYRDCYDAVTRRVVEDCFAFDLELFDYSF